MDGLDEMSENAFNDECTGANPVYPLISEIRELYLRALLGQGLRCQGQGRYCRC